MTWPPRVPAHGPGAGALTLDELETMGLAELPAIVLTVAIYGASRQVMPG